jgi:hypothetical protein
MLRGRYICAISERSTPSSTLKISLSPIIPVHPGLSPVTPIIPVHTQKQGGWGMPSNASTDNSLVYVTAYLLATKIQNVAAPTFLATLRTSVLGNANLPIGGLARR